MRIHRITLIVLLAAAWGCSIEPTPREYIDRPRVEEPQTAVRELIDERVRLVVQFLAAGDPAGARSGLAPAPNVRVYGPGARDRFEGAPQIDSLIDLIAAAAARGALRLRELEVEADSRGSVAWFAAILELDVPEQPTTPLRATGVFHLREGEWELHQAHVAAARADSTTASYPAAPPAPEGAE